MIELVHHPLGVQDSAGHKVELLHDPGSLTWTRLPRLRPVCLMLRSTLSFAKRQ